MRKLFLILTLLVGGLCLQAQGWLKVARPKATSKTFQKYPWKVSSQLYKRAERTYDQAYLLEAQLQQQTALALLRRSQSASRVTSSPDISTLDELYPQMKGLIRTKYQLSDYFVAQNNRQVLKHATDETAHLMLMQQNIDHLKSTQIISSGVRGQEMQWLVKQIPADTDYLLLGEVHNIPEIYQHLPLLPQLLRRKFGERQIIWLTEFLPDSCTPGMINENLQKYVPPNLLNLWNTIKTQDIPVVGIEPFPAFTENTHLYRPSKTGKRNQLSMWETYEGIRLRNKFWKEKIDAIRRDNPHALIVLHAGFGHLDYTFPYSMGAHLRQKERTFTVSLVPGYDSQYQTTLEQLFQELKVTELMPIPCPDDGFTPTTFFDFATRGNFPQQALQFGPGDWFITGFDVQLKIPAFPKP